jgi:hypothetical protein
MEDAESHGLDRGGISGSLTRRDSLDAAMDSAPNVGCNRLSKTDPGLVR